MKEKRPVCPPWDDEAFRGVLNPSARYVRLLGLPPFSEGADRDLRFA
jgi:hypothetical protein